MYIVAIAWIYVVFMMSAAEQSVIAGIMTFMLYGVLPLSVILYLIGVPQRKRRREETEKMQCAALDHAHAIASQKDKIKESSPM